MASWTPEERAAHYAKKEALRQERAAKYEANLAEEAAIREAKVMAPVKPPASRFTTQAAVDWGRWRGWRLVDRERYDVRTNRHHDSLFGTDALFLAKGIGLVGVQGAGRYERVPHRLRFDQCGGEVAALEAHVRVVYVEFVRNEAEPLVEEWWS